MAGTGTAPALANDLAGIDSDDGSVVPGVPARVREGARWFFWIVGLATMNSLFTIMGSHIHRFTGFGVTAMLGRFFQTSASSGVMQVIVSGWFAAGLLFLGYCAAEGQKWAFVAGMAVYAVDGALLIGSGDYLSAVVHAVLLYLIYRGFAALGQSASAEPTDAASAAHAG
jgi:hypothetical protein